MTNYPLFPGRIDTFVQIKYLSEIPRKNSFSILLLIFRWYFGIPRKLFNNVFPTGLSIILIVKRPKKIVFNNYLIF